jgi:hypothetical protein
MTTPPDAHGGSSTPDIEEFLRESGLTEVSIAAVATHFPRWRVFLERQGIHTLPSPRSVQQEDLRAIDLMNLLLSTAANTTEIAHACDAALASIVHWLESVSIPASRENMNRYVAAGFVARSVSLLRAIGTLANSSQDDIGGYLYRGVIECYILGLYVLLGGELALDHVLGDHRRNVDNFIQRNPDPHLEEMVEGWAIPSQHLHLEDVARKVGPLLDAAGEPNEGATGLYDAAFRNASTFDTHGFGALMRYFARKEPDWRIIVRPEPQVMESYDWLGLGMLLALHLTAHAQAAGGDSLDEIAGHLDRLNTIFQTGPVIGDVS